MNVHYNNILKKLYAEMYDEIEEKFGNKLTYDEFRDIALAQWRSAFLHLMDNTFPVVRLRNFGAFLVREGRGKRGLKIKKNYLEKNRERLMDNDIVRLTNLCSGLNKYLDVFRIWESNSLDLGDLDMKNRYTVTFKARHNDRRIKRVRFTNRVTAPTYNKKSFELKFVLKCDMFKEKGKHVEKVIVVYPNNKFDELEVKFNLI